MRKSNITKVLLSGALAMSVFAFAGCSDPEAEFREAFEQSSLTQDFDPSKYYRQLEFGDGYTNDTPYYLTNAEYELEEANGIEGCNIEATFENESYTVIAHILAAKDPETGEFEYGVSEEAPNIVPKKGIDTYWDFDVNNTEGITSTYDPNSQTCTVTFDHVHGFDVPLAYDEINGTSVIKWNGVQWESDNGIEEEQVLNVSAIEGTYAPDNAEAPIVTISNVRTDDLGRWKFDIAYTFDGIDISDTGEIEMPHPVSEENYHKFLMRSTGTDYPAKHDDVEGVNTLFSGTLTDENGKTLIKDVHISNSEYTASGFGFRWNGEPFEVELNDVNYTKQ